MTFSLEEYAIMIKHMASRSCRIINDLLIGCLCWLRPLTTEANKHPQLEDYHFLSSLPAVVCTIIMSNTKSGSSSAIQVHFNM